MSSEIAREHDSADAKPNIGTTLARPHVWRPGAASPPLLLLHGTGGDEHALLHLGDDLAPGAPLLSPRGMVLEGSLPRFFRRISEGVFDESDLRYRTDELADFLTAASGEYHISRGALVTIGFSNGANTACSLLSRHPQVVHAAVLIAAMPPYQDGLGGVDLTGKRVAIVNGRNDPIVSQDDTARLVAQLGGSGADVTLFAHDDGHTVPPSILPDLREFITATAELRSN